MPKLIPHPETLRRQTQQDVYFIGEFPVPDPDTPDGARSRFKFPLALSEWLAQHMSDVRWGEMGPSELSGWLLGGPRYYFLTLSEQQALEYAAHWERPDPLDNQGRNRDAAAGFRCYVLPAHPWRERLDACVVHRAPPPASVQRFVAWNTPQEGWLWAEMAPCGRPTDFSDPTLSVRDLWLRAKELFPRLATDRPGQGTAVETIVDRGGNSVNCLLIQLPELPDEEVLSTGVERGARTRWQQEVCTALGLVSSAVRFDWAY